MPYDNVMSRTDAAALIPENVSREIIQGIPEQSAFLQLATRLQNMPTNVTRMPVLSLLPIAYWVTGDNGLKQTTEINWANKYLYAEEAAVILPIPESVLDDANYDVWGQSKPRIMEAFGKLIDAAAFFGTNAPDNFPDDIYTAAIAAGNEVVLGTGVDLYEDILGDGGLVSKMEAEGYMADGYYSAVSMRGKLRSVRASDGQPIFRSGMVGGTQYSLDGSPMYFAMNGAFSTTVAYMIAMMKAGFVYSFRQDLTYKILDQASLTNIAGQVVLNLPQQDMVALRCVLRWGWQCPNPINALQPTEASRYPAAVLSVS